MEASSEHLNASQQELAGQAGQNAEQVAQIAARSEQLGDATRQSSEQARQTRQLSGEVQTRAEGGMQAIDELQTSMSDIAALGDSARVMSQSLTRSNAAIQSNRQQAGALQDTARELLATLERFRLDSGASPADERGRQRHPAPEALI